MERNEMIEVLMKKADLSHEEAEKCITGVQLGLIRCVSSFISIFICTMYDIISCWIKYSITSDKSSYADVNNIFNKAFKSADNIKKDFKEGYNN